MKAKTFLFLWVLGFLFVAPKWMATNDALNKAKAALAHPQQTAQVTTGTTLSYSEAR